MLQKVNTNGMIKRGIMVLFELTMPRVNSWNGKWSGEGSFYGISMWLDQEKEKELHGQDFYYDFGDGWEACVSCKKVDPIYGDTMMKRSKGFSGYDWMVESIIKIGEIKPERLR
jgi:hypothetical protein